LFIFDIVRNVIYPTVSFYIYIEREKRGRIKEKIENNRTIIIIRSRFFIN